MAHRFGPRKGPLKKDRPEGEPAPARPEKDDLLSKDLLGEGLLGGDDPPLLAKGKGKGKDREADKEQERSPAQRKLLPARKGLPQRPLPSSGGDMPWLYILGGGIVLIGLIVGLSVGYMKSQVPGYTDDVAVAEPTRLDWVFVASDERVSSDPPALWSFFDTPRLSRYELFVPPSYEPEGKQRYPMVLFLSPGDRPVGWSRWSKVCQDQGIIFAGVREAGPSKPFWQKVRIALDVLDDVRRQYRIDTDRCYIAGLGEGADLACQIAFALPEFFGGVVAIDGGAFLHDEAWLRHRNQDRLSVAVVNGGESMDHGQTDRLWGPYFRDVGIRNKLWTIPQLGDAVPAAEVLAEIFAWLEEGASQRAALARRFPASRLDDPPSREKWSQLVLDEAQSQLSDPKSLYRGVVQLRGVARRWVGYPAALQAGKLLVEKYLPRDDWKEEEKLDQARHDLPAARGLTAYLTGEFPPGFVDRNWQRQLEWTTRANHLWKSVAAVLPEHAEEAKQGMANLDKALNRPTNSRR